MTNRGMEIVGIKAVIDGLPQYLAGAKAISAANAGISGSLSGLSNITKGFAVLASAAAGVTAALGGASIAAATKFETSLAKIDALTNTTSEDTARLGKGILALSKVVPKSPGELGAAAYFALSSGITDVDEALKLVTAASKASAAGLGSTADIVDIVTAAVNAYGPANLDAARAVDILVAAVREGKGEPAQMAAALGTLLPLAAQLKIPFEEVAGVFASLTNALGGSGAAELAGTQFRGILNQIISPSKEAKYALAEAQAGIKTLSQEELALADASRATVQAQDALNASHRGVRDAAEGVVQAQRGVRDAQQGVADAQRSSRSATEALRNAYADLTAAQRNQQQASLDGRRETLSVMEAEQGLVELRTQAGSHATEVAAAELALAQARENASSKDKKTSIEQRQAALAITQAEQRLNQVRAQGPRYALDLQNAELRIHEARLRVGTAQKQQDKDVADRQKNIVKATQDVTDASRNELKAREGLSDARRNEVRAVEAVADAKRAEARAGTDLALAQEKELLAQIHTRDAYAALRKEIAEKGLPQAMQNLNELFKDNQEGLAKLFPDVRAFTGFLAAMRGEGNATATAVQNIYRSLGLTDEVFKRMSETTAHQAGILKNQLNVALIALGSAALPLVNAGLLKLNGYLAKGSEFFAKGFNGTTLGGEFGKVEKAAFSAGEKVRELIQWIKDNQESIKSVFSFVGETFLKDAKATINWFIEHKDQMALAFAVIGTFFALSNPAWAGILAGGAIILGVELLKRNLEDLSSPLINARIEVDKFLLRVLQAAEKTRRTLLGVTTLGVSELPGVKDVLNQSPEQKAIDKAQKDLADDIADANAELSKRGRILEAEKEIQRRLLALQDEARQKAISLDDALQVEVETMLRLGGGADGFARKLVDAAATIKGVDPSRIEYLRMEITKAELAAKGLTTNVTGTVGPIQNATVAAEGLAGATASVEPPAIGDAGRSRLDAATEAGLRLDESLVAVDPPDVADAGKGAIDNATIAAQGEQKALDNIEPPYVADAGLSWIAKAALAAIDEKNQLAAVRPPNVGDSGWAKIAAAAREAENLRRLLEAAGQAASKIGTGLVGGATNLLKRADGGVVRRPEFALIGEAGPEAVLPLSDPMRSRQIIASLSPAFVAAMMPRPLAEGGLSGGSFSRAGLSRYADPADAYIHPSYDFINAFRDAYLGESGASNARSATGTDDSGGAVSGTGESSRAGIMRGADPADTFMSASRQVYATLPPSLIRSMSAPSNGSVTFESMFGGDINVGATSREVESLVVSQIRAVFARARTQTAIGGGLITSGIG